MNCLLRKFKHAINYESDGVMRLAQAGAQVRFRIKSARLQELKKNINECANAIEIEIKNIAIIISSN